MAEIKKPDPSYTCPHCGQKAVFGSHFCQTVAAPQAEAAVRPVRKGARGNQGVLALVALALVVLVAWRWLGPGSLVLAALAGLGFLLWGTRQGGPKAAYRELVSACKGQETAERLIADEMVRQPKLTRDQAVREALARYRRDLSR